MHNDAVTCGRRNQASGIRPAGQEVVVTRPVGKVVRVSNHDEATTERNHD